MRRESRALLALTRGEGEPSPEHSWDDLDARALLGLARAHQLDALVGWRRRRPRTSGRARRLALPDEVERAFHTAWLHHSVRNEALARDLAAVERALDARGIESIVFKGPWLAFSAWPSPGARPVDDIDLGVREVDFAEAVAALAELGYAPDSELPSTPAAALRRAHHGEQLRFTARGRRPVELHFRLVNVGPPAEAEPWVWGPARALALEGTELRVPGAQAMLLHLLLHANQHGFAPLRLLFDLRFALARDAPTLEPGALIERVSALRMRTSAWHGLTLAREQAGAEVPAGLLDALRPGLVRRRSFERVWHLDAVRRLKAPRVDRALEAPRLYLLAMGRWRDKLRYVHGLAAEAGGFMRLARRAVEATNRRAFNRRLRAGALVALLLLAAALPRLGGLATLSLWWDEFYTQRVATQGWAEILRAPSTLHPPGFPVLAKLALSLGGEPWTMRVPALLGGLLGILVLWLGCGRIATARLGAGLVPDARWLASLLLAGSVYHVYYSQEARSYTWMTTLVGAACFAGLAYARRPSAARLAGLLALCLAASSFHFMALPSCLALLGVAGLARSRRRVSRGELAIGLAALVAAATAAYVQRARILGISTWLFAPTETRVVVGRELVCDTVGRWSGLGVEAGGVALAFALLGLVACWKRSRAAAVILFAAIAAPFATVAVVPWHRAFEIRYVMAGLIPFIALLALGLDLLVRRGTHLLAGRAPPWLARTAAVVLVALPLGLQWNASIAHALAPRKYAAYRNTSAFGYRHVNGISRIDTWMVADTGGGTFATKRTAVGPIDAPVPRWVTRRTANAEAGWALELQNSRADDVLRVFVLRDPSVQFNPQDVPCAELCTPRAETIGRRTVLFTYVNRVTGRELGFLRLVGRCPANGVRYLFEVQSARLSAARAYLAQVDALLFCARDRREGEATR